MEGNLNFCTMLYSQHMCCVRLCIAISPPPGHFAQQSCTLCPKRACRHFPPMFWPVCTTAVQPCPRARLAGVC